LQLLELCEEIRDPKNDLLFNYKEASLICWLKEFEKYILEKKHDGETAEDIDFPITHPNYKTDQQA